MFCAGSALTCVGIAQAEACGSLVLLCGMGILFLQAVGVAGAEVREFEGSDIQLVAEGVELATCAAIAAHWLVVGDALVELSEKRVQLGEERRIRRGFLNRREAKHGQNLRLR